MSFLGRVSYIVFFVTKFSPLGESLREVTQKYDYSWQRQQPRVQEKKSAKAPT